MTDERAKREALADRIRAEASARAVRVANPGARAILLRAAERRAERVLAGLPVDLSYLRTPAPVPPPRAIPRAPCTSRDLRDANGAPRPTTRRPCLRCACPFDSHGPGNRLCPACRVRLADASPYAV